MTARELILSIMNCVNDLDDEIHIKNIKDNTKHEYISIDYDDFGNCNILIDVFKQDIYA